MSLELASIESSLVEKTLRRSAKKIYLMCECKCTEIADKMTWPQSGLKGAIVLCNMEDLWWGGLLDLGRVVLLSP